MQTETLLGWCSKDFSAYKTDIFAKKKKLAKRGIFVEKVKKELEKKGICLRRGDLDVQTSKQTVSLQLCLCGSVKKKNLGSK